MKPIYVLFAIMEGDKCYVIKLHSILLYIQQIAASSFFAFQAFGTGDLMDLQHNSKPFQSRIQIAGLLSFI